MVHHCKNCQTKFHSNFCPECGQNAHVGRLTMHELIHEIWHGFTHTDKGFLKLCKELLLHPKLAYQNYFSGKRKSYFSPVVFFLLSFGIFIFLDQKVFDYQDYIYRTNNPNGFNEYGREIQLSSKYIALSLLPFQAIISWLFFYNKKNLAECIVFWLYCVGFLNIVYSLFTPLRLIFITHKELADYILLTIITLCIILLHSWQVFGYNNWNKIKVLLLIFIVSIINLYISYYFAIEHIGIPLSYPSLTEAISKTFWWGN